MRTKRARTAQKSVPAAADTAGLDAEQLKAVRRQQRRAQRAAAKAAAEPARQLKIAAANAGRQVEQASDNVSALSTGPERKAPDSVHAAEPMFRVGDDVRVIDCTDCGVLTVAQGTASWSW